MRLKLLAATTVLITAIASPAFAIGPQARSEQAQQRQYDSRAYDQDAYEPGDAVGGVVNGALGTAGAIVGTAGAIATAPFEGGAYAYNTGYGPGYRSEFICRPGTSVIGANGVRYPCQ